MVVSVFLSGARTASSRTEGFVRASLRSTMDAYEKLEKIGEGVRATNTAAVCLLAAAVSRVCVSRIPLRTAVRYIDLRASSAIVSMALGRESLNESERRPPVTLYCIVGST